MALHSPFENNHKPIVGEEFRRKLSFLLLSLTGVACVALLIILGRGL